MSILVRVKEQTTCAYCATTFDKDLRYCPLCRRPIIDLSGRHTQVPNPVKQIPITYSIPEKVHIIINRGMKEGGNENIKGTVISETSTYYKVHALSPYNISEWFAKASNRVNCYPLRSEGESARSNG